MKSLYYSLPLLVFCFLASPSHAALGRHNGQISLGFAGLVKTEARLGYAFNVELGYLLHSVRPSKTIHAMDLRLGFDASFPSEKESALGISLKSSAQNYFGSLSIAYAAGREIKGHRLMFDVIGFGFGFGSSRETATLDFLGVRAKAKGDPSFGLRMDYILPLGINFIASNGVSAGFRHKFSLPFGTISVDELGMPRLAYQYSLIFHIGYAFGGKS